MTVTITASELADALAADTPPVVLDVRWSLGGPPGHDEYLKGHVPGAVYVDLETELARHGEPTDGRHPLPDTAALQESMRRWGLHDGGAVVVYDGGDGWGAARAWWLLRWAGVGDVRILDGQLPAWTTAEQPLETDDVVPESGDAWARPGTLPMLTLEDAGDFDGILLDARAAERFRGESEPIDPKAGHIPGAVSAPTTDNVGEDGRFLSPEELRQRFTDLGLDDTMPIGVYCGSGVSACHEIAALQIAGFDAVLFPGSWSQWSNHDLPVATGD